MSTISNQLPNRAEKINNGKTKTFFWIKSIRSLRSVAFFAVILARKLYICENMGRDYQNNRAEVPYTSALGVGLYEQ